MHTDVVIMTGSGEKGPIVINLLQVHDTRQFSYVMKPPLPQ